MRARMITSLAGPEGRADAGQVVDGPDARIQELIDGGYAEPFTGTGTGKPVEDATVCRLREVAASPAAERKRKGRGPDHTTS